MSYYKLQDFFNNRKIRMIMAADAEPRTTQLEGKKTISLIPPGGVAVALDPVAKASGAVYVGRGKNEDEKKVLDRNNKMEVKDQDGNYTLKRIFMDEKEMDGYYYGFSNQTLWPLCHVAFEKPQFRQEWYEIFKKINHRFAAAIKEEIKGKTVIWLNDYHLSLVPKYLSRPKDSIVAMFWHIPWPTWEAFRILPQKEEILESLLSCDFIAFHRGYQVRNFLNTIKRELEARIDYETGRVFFNKNVTYVKNLPMGIDTDVVGSILNTDDSLIGKIAKKLVNADIETDTSKRFDSFFNNKVIIGVDRLDYTKGLILRLIALDKFFEKNKQYLEKVTYIGIIAPSREKIASYSKLWEDVSKWQEKINTKYGTAKWQPIKLIHEMLSRDVILNLFKKSQVCLVTPLDDGMNLVSKEFVMASSFARNPGMLVLSQFAGSAIDLTDAIIVNPYCIEDVADAIKKALEMDRFTKVKIIEKMKKTLEERNVYVWAEEFMQNTLTSSKAV